MAAPVPSSGLDAALAGTEDAPIMKSTERCATYEEYLEQRGYKPVKCCGDRCDLGSTWYDLAIIWACLLVHWTISALLLWGCLTAAIATSESHAFVWMCFWALFFSACVVGVSFTARSYSIELNERHNAGKNDEEA